MLGSKKFHNTEEGIKEMVDYIISSFGDMKKYRITNPKNISSVFLAGAPGSGKSEFLDTILCELKENFIIIDIDTYRNMFLGYNGENSSEYQISSVKVSQKIINYCFENSLNFVFDGTFRNFNKVKENFQRCEKHNRKILLVLIYQEPKISFYYTFLRKINKKRNVPVDIFVAGFYDSIQNVFRAVRSFNNINLIVAGKTYKDIDGHIFEQKLYPEIKDIQEFCRIFRIAYSKGVFTNREKMRIDIEDFQNTLVAQFSGNLSVWRRFKIWVFKKNL